MNASKLLSKLLFVLFIFLVIFGGLMNTNRMIWKLVFCTNYLHQILMDHSHFFLLWLLFLPMPRLYHHKLRCGLVQLNLAIMLHYELLAVQNTLSVTTAKFLLIMIISRCSYYLLTIVMHRLDFLSPLVA